MSIFKWTTEPKKIYIRVPQPWLDMSWDFTTMTSSEYDSEFSYKNKCALSSGTWLIPSGAGSDQAWYVSKLVTSNWSQFNVIEATIKWIPASWWWLWITFSWSASSTVKGRNMFWYNWQNYWIFSGTQYDVKWVFAFWENNKICSAQYHDTATTEYYFKINLDTWATVLNRAWTQIASWTASSTYLNTIKTNLAWNVYVYIGGQYSWNWTNLVEQASIHLWIE